MARKLVDVDFTDKKARKALACGVHWRAIDHDSHLGYRKSERGGVWLVRWRNGTGYRQSTLGAVLEDEDLKAGKLDFRAALATARTAIERAREEEAAIAAGPPITVRSAVERYMAMRDARASKRAGRPIRSDGSQRLERFVIGRPARGRRPAVEPHRIADVELRQLRERDLMDWRDGLPDELKAATRQRTVSDLKAALNAAHAADRDRLPAKFPNIVKHALKAVVRDEGEPIARDNQILTQGQVYRLLSATKKADAELSYDGDFYRLVLVLAAAGARFSQVARMRVRDAQLDQERLMVPVSRKGRARQADFIPVPVGVDVIKELRPVVNGRSGDAFLLERSKKKKLAGTVQWVEGEREPWRYAAELHRPWERVRKLAGMDDVIVYALRHTSIVKAIRANLPLRLVAALHDTSTAMIERHYSRWIATGLEEMARQAIEPIVPIEKGNNVVELRGGAR